MIGHGKVFCFLISASRAGMFPCAGRFAGGGFGNRPFAVGMLFTLCLITAGADYTGAPVAVFVTVEPDIHVFMLFVLVGSFPMVFPFITADAGTVFTTGFFAVALTAGLTHLAVIADGGAFTAGISAVRANGGAVFANAAVAARICTITADFAALAAQFGAVLTAVTALAATILQAGAALNAMSTVFNTAFMAHTAFVAPVISAFTAKIAVTETGSAFRIIAALAVGAMHSFIDGTVYALKADTTEVFATI